MAEEEIVKKKKEKKPEPRSLYGGILALVFLIVVLVLLQFSVFNKETFVKGAKTERVNNSEDVEQAKEDISNGIDTRLDNLKNQVNNLEPEDVVSNSAQFQKILNDFESLKAFPKNELKNFCDSVCEKI